MLLDKRNRLLNVKIPQAVLRRDRLAGQGTRQKVQKQIEVSDQLQHGGVFVLDDVEHLAAHGVPQGGLFAAVDGLLNRKACDFQGFLHPQTVKFYPHIFPRRLTVRDVGRDMAGCQQKALILADGVMAQFAVGIRAVEHAVSSEHIVEQKMVSRGGTETVAWRALFRTHLVDSQIDEIVAWKDVKLVFHKGSFSVDIAIFYLNYSKLIKRKQNGIKTALYRYS